MVNVQFGQYFA